MTTRNEILERHGLSRDDVAILSDELMGWEKVNPKLERCSHALCSQNYVDHWDCWGAKFNIVAYYPEPGVYLVKRVKQREKFELLLQRDSTHNDTHFRRLQMVRKL